VAIIGGAKISTKVSVLENMLARVEVLWVGGAMACTFFRALGADTGTSLVEDEHVETARRLLDLARASHAELRLPEDVVVARSPTDAHATGTVDWRSIPADQMVVDIGPQTCARILDDARGAGSVVWNGPLGIYEIEAFAAGTRSVAQGLVETSADTIIGGGDLAAAVKDAGVADRMGFISTGGGATIEFLEGRTLPGVAALRDRAAVAS
jgi:phosphoglycerate kinase